MSSRLIQFQPKHVLVGIAAAFTLAACSSDAINSTTSGMMPVLSGNFSKVENKHIAAYGKKRSCPKVKVVNGTQTLRIFVRGKELDPFGLRYQATIGQTSRDCGESGGLLHLSVGVAGRVIPGPMGAAETVKFPLRIAVVGPGEEVIVSKLHMVEIAIADPSRSGRWVKVDSEISVPNRDDLEVLVGFDQQTKKKK